MKNRQLIMDRRLIVKKNKRFFSCVFLLWFMVCLWPVSVFSRDITVQAEVSARTVALDDYIRLTLSVTGVQTLDPVDLLDMEGFQHRLIGPSSRVSIINGKYSSSYAFLYDLYPEKTGTFTIPAITLMIQGKEYQTDPIVVEVVSSAGAVQSARSGDSTVLSAESLKDRLFLIMASPYTEVYLNQKVPVIVRLYIAGLSVRDVEYPEIGHTGFLMDSFEQPRQFEEVISGMRYSVVEFRTHVYPTRTGELLLGPAKGRCNILMKSSSRSRRSGSFGFFDDDFFSGFFDSYTSRPVVMESEPLKMIVHSLPERNRPEDFSGAVGKFSFNMSVSPKTVKVGDPVTVRMTVTGTGNLRTFDMPRFQSDKDFRVYDPVIREENGIKLLEQVLIPQSVKADSMPEVSFSFFDVEEEEYRTISWGPVLLEVEPVDRGREFQVVGLGDAGVTRRDDIGRDISFIKTDPGVFRSGRAAYYPFVFVFGSFVILIAWAGGVLFYHFTYRLKTDERFAKRLQAPVYARKGLKKARACLDQVDKEGFYNELFKTLERYFSHKFHLAPGAVTVNFILSKLERKEKNDAIAEKLRSVFNECEAARYASARFSHDQMARTYQKSREIIDWFEKI